MRYYIKLGISKKREISHVYGAYRIDITMRSGLLDQSMKQMCPKMFKDLNDDYAHWCRVELIATYELNAETIQNIVPYYETKKLILIIDLA